jgi:hypothetical protein
LIVLLLDFSLFLEISKIKRERRGTRGESRDGYRKELG